MKPLLLTAAVLTVAAPVLAVVLLIGRVRALMRDIERHLRDGVDIDSGPVAAVESKSR